jgi:hypothetical protein
MILMNQTTGEHPVGGPWPILGVFPIMDVVNYTQEVITWPIG